MIRGLASFGACALVLAIASASLAQPVLVTAPTTINPGDTTIGGVALATAQITVHGTTLTVNGERSIASLRLEDDGVSPGVLTHDAGFGYTDGSGNARFGFHLTTSGGLTVVGGALPSAIDVSGRGYFAGSGPGSLRRSSGSPTS